MGLRQRLSLQAQQLLEQTERENQTLAVARPELRAVFAGELRCLRAIRALIAEQVERLA